MPRKLPTYSTQYRNTIRKVYKDVWSNTEAGRRKAAIYRASGEEQTRLADMMKAALAARRTLQEAIKKKRGGRGLQILATRTIAAQKKLDTALGMKSSYRWRKCKSGYRDMWNNCAGASTLNSYFCTKCQRRHHLQSGIGQGHLKFAIKD